MKSEWISALAKSLEDSADKVPTGWKTSRQISEEMGKSIGHTQRVVQSLINSGAAECKTFKLSVQNCGVRPVPHYRIKKKAA